jgi:hypothetical protein
MGPTDGLDAVAKRCHHCPHRELNSGYPARSLVAILTKILQLPHTNVQYEIVKSVNC